MSCYKYLPLVLLLIASVVVAYVRGQDDQQLNWGSNSPSQDLGAELRSVGRTVTAEYQNSSAPQVLQVPGGASPLPTSPLKLVAANDPVGSDGLRSVLVRPGQNAAPAEDRQEAAVETETEWVAPRTAMLPPKSAVETTVEEPAASEPLVTPPAADAGTFQPLSPPPSAPSDQEPPSTPARPAFTPPTTTYEPLISPSAPAATEPPQDTAAEETVEAPMSTPLDPPATHYRPLTGSEDDARSSSRRTFGAPMDEANAIANPTAAGAAADASAFSPLPSDRRTLGSGLLSPPAETTVQTPTTGVLASSVGPLLRVETKGPKAITLGEPADFVVSVANPGTADAENVTVRVAIPEHVKLAAANSDIGSAEQLPGSEGVSIVSWSLRRLAARTDAKLTLQLAPQANRPFDLAVDWSMLPISATTQIEVQQPMLEIAVQGPDQIVFGETKVYSIVLSNPGTGDAKNVSVNLSLGSEQADALNIGTLPAGKSQKYDVEVSARQPGVLQIAAVARAEYGLAAQAVEQISVLKAELSLEALASKVKYAGSVGTYQVTVKNTGNAVASNVRMQVQLPLGVKYFQGLTDAAQTGDILQWNVGDLGASQERVFVFYCQLEAAGEAKLDFVAKGDGGLAAAANTTTRVEALADLKLAVNDPKGPLPVGQEVTYEIQVVNRGSKAATGVNVVAQFSEGIEPVAAQGADAQLMEGQVVFAPIERIAPNETLVLKVKAKAENKGNHLFRAEVRCSDPETRLVAEDTTQYFARDMFEPTGTAASPSDLNEDDFVPVGSRP